VKDARVRPAYHIFLVTLHNRNVDGLSRPAALKEKLKPILAPKG
jgi:hypothetical protein